MPDLPSDTVIVNIPLDADSLPQYVILRFTQARHNFATRKPPYTNQEVLNLFRRVFGLSYWEVVERAGLGWLEANRKAVYSGADVEELPLAEVEKKRIIAAM